MDDFTKMTQLLLKDYKGEEPAIHLLLIEDDLSDVERIKSLLDKSATKYFVSQASSLREAMLILQTESKNIDIILADTTLPDCHGIEIVRELTIENETTPIIVLSHIQDDDFVEQCLNIGAQDFLIKKVEDKRTLQRAIHHAILRRKEILRYSSLVKTDPLTGLASREYFHNSLARAMAKASRNLTRVALIYFDLDRSKQISDTLGHAAGDRLLIEVSKRLTNVLRSRDTLARLGGDEFAVVVENISDAEEVITVADSILQEFLSEFTLCQTKVRVSTNIGISVFPEDGKDFETLLQNADIAMSQAKCLGRNRYQFFEWDMHRDNVQRMELEKDMRRAIENDEFELFYQPRIDINTGLTVGLEALLRWHHTRLGLIPNDQLITIAEKSGYIVEIGQWVLTRACQQINDWHNAGLVVPRIAINLSAVELEHSGFADWFTRTMRSWHVSPDSIELEVTEATLMKDVEQYCAILSELKALGITIAIDDFGLGYSCLSNLQYMPIDCLKIHESLVKRVTSEDTAFIHAIVALGHSLNLRLVAEGVETMQQKDVLARAGCDYVQGHLIAAPVAAQTVESFMVQRRSIVNS